MSNTNDSPQLDAARNSLLNAMRLVDTARETQGQPGGQANLVAAEIACGRFVADHGKNVLNYMLAVQGINLEAAQEVRHVA